MMPERSLIFSLLDQQIIKLVNLELNEILNNPDECCIEYSWVFTKSHRFKIHHIARQLGFNSYTHVINGQKFIKIYKKTCKKFPNTLTTFRLTNESSNEINKFLNNETSSNASPGISTIPLFTLNPKSKIPLYRFSLVTTVNNKSRNDLKSVTIIPQKIKSIDNLDERSFLPIYKYYSHILDLIKANNISIINGDAGYGKTTQIPQYILQYGYLNKKQYRIISIQLYKLAVLYLSEKITEQLGEKSPTTVGYQIDLQNCCSPTASLLLTTLDFFLRCLICNEFKDVYNDITHIIIDDYDNVNSIYFDILLLEIKNILIHYPNMKIIIIGNGLHSNEIQLLQDYYKSYKIDEIKLDPLDKNSSTLTMSMNNDELYLDDLPFIKYYLLDILDDKERINNQMMKLNEKNEKFYDLLIGEYIVNNNNYIFEYLLHLIKTDVIPINIQHKKTKYTLLIASIKHYNWNNIFTLLELNINPYTPDINNMNAFDWAAKFGGSIYNWFMSICIYNQKNMIQQQIQSPTTQFNNSYSQLANYCEVSQLIDMYYQKFSYDCKIDHKLLFTLIKYIHEKNSNNQDVDNDNNTADIADVLSYSTYSNSTDYGDRRTYSKNYVDECDGSIIVFLPDYENLIIQKHILIQNMIKKNINDIQVYLFHDNIEKIELDGIISEPETSNAKKLRKIILCTDIVEKSINLYNVIAVIDTGLDLNLTYYHNDNEYQMNSNTKKYEYITKMKAYQRKIIVKRSQLLKNKNESDDTGNVTMWANNKTCYCYRLYSKRLFNEKFSMHYNVKDLKNYTLNIKSYEKICLYIKLFINQRKLTKTINDFTLDLIRTPPKYILDESIKNLKILDALDENENVTMLGIRLIDIPTNDIRNGKMILFSVVLKCLDPVLTIASLLDNDIYMKVLTSNCNSYLEINNQNNDNIIDDELLQLKNNLHENTFSDHLVLLRLFQKWQDELQIPLCELFKSSSESLQSTSNQLLNLESENLINSNYKNYFKIDGLLKYAHCIRSQILGLLRAVGLVKQAGVKSINSINKNSDNWPLIKACIAAGNYQNICLIDNDKYENLSNMIKSNTNKSLMLNKDSTLNDKLIKLKDYGRNGQLQNQQHYLNSESYDWFIYENKIKIDNIHNLNCNTLITPLTIALFCGKVKLSKTNINSYNNRKEISTISNFGNDDCGSDLEVNIDIIMRNNNNNNGNGRYNQNNRQKLTQFTIDGWLTFVLNENDANLILNLREHFFNYFLNIIGTNEICIEKNHNNHHNKNEMIMKKKSKQNQDFNDVSIIDSIAKIFQYEDISKDFAQPEKCGVRPTAAITAKLVNELEKSREEIIRCKENCDKKKLELLPSSQSTIFTFTDTKIIPLNQTSRSFSSNVNMLRAVPSSSSAVKLNQISKSFSSNVNMVRAVPSTSSAVQLNQISRSFSSNVNVPQTEPSSNSSAVQLNQINYYILNICYIGRKLYGDKRFELLNLTEKWQSLLEQAFESMSSGVNVLLYDVEKKMFCGIGKILFGECDSFLNKNWYLKIISKNYFTAEVFMGFIGLQNDEICDGTEISFKSFDILKKFLKYFSQS